MDLKHIIPQQRRRTFGPSLDIQYSVDRSDVPRVGPTPVFTRASSGTFVNENRRIVGKTTSTTSLNPANVAVGGVAVFAVPSGSVVGWLNNSVVSVMVDSDGDDQIGSEAHVTGTLIHKTNTAITLLVTSKAGTATVSSWFVSYRGQRIDHDPATGRCLGTLVEEGKTNLLLRSGVLSNTTSWTTYQVTSSTASVLAPDGTATATQFTENTTNDSHTFYGAFGNNRPTTGAVSCTFSIFLSAGTRRYVMVSVGQSPNFVGMMVDTQNWSVTDAKSSGTGWTYISNRLTNYGNGWYRAELTFTPPAATTVQPTVCGSTTSTFTNVNAIVYLGNGSTFIAWGAQLEAGLNATSYIPTTATSVARSAEVPTISGDEFSRFYNQTEGTFIVNYDRSTTSGGSIKFNWMVLAAYNPASSSTYNVIVATQTSDARTIYRHSGTDVYGPVPSLSAAGTLVKIGYRYQSGNFITTKNGSVVSTGTGTIPATSTFDRIDFGFSNNGNFGVTSGQYLNGHINSIRYYRNRLPNPQLQTLTAIVTETIVYNGVPIWYNGEGLIETS